MAIIKDGRVVKAVFRVFLWSVQLTGIDTSGVISYSVTYM
jgi:hypothetical protein